MFELQRLRIRRGYVNKGCEMKNKLKIEMIKV